MARNWLKENNPRYKHGCTNTRLFHIWQHMKARCNCPTNKAYGDYGGRIFMFKVITDVITT